MYKKITPTILFLFFIGSVFGQINNQLWKDISTSSAKVSNESPSFSPETFRTIEFNQENLKSILQAAPQRQTTRSENAAGVTLSIPMPDGKMKSFRLVESSVFEPELAAKFPSIQSYTGTGIDDPTAILKLSISPKGLNAWVSSAKHGDVFIDPYSKGTPDVVMSYYKKNLQRENQMRCEVQDALEISVQAAASEQAFRPVGNCELHTFRLAIACTGEYYNAIGAGSTADVIAEYNVAMTRVNGLYERDAGITMVLVGNTDLLVYTNPATDPYTNNDGIAMLGENQATVDAVIGTANYDIGHVFSTGGGGIASLRSPCSATRKAQGVTGLPNPTGDPFYVDFVAHEIGHQFGGNHTFNGNTSNCGGGTRNGPTSVEPASGNTIMAYAGICAPNNVQNNSDAVFHIVSIEEFIDNILNGVSTCGVVTNPVNSQPTSDAGLDYTIPGGTKFFLTGTGTDADAGTTLTYTWEQIDTGTGSGAAAPSATDVDGPLFKAFPISDSPTRYFPNLPAALAGTSPTYEVLPTVSRTMEFGFTVRDIDDGFGCVATDEAIVTVDGASGPFVLTAPNAAVTWNVGGPETITWDAAGTAGAPVNATNVDIFLSTDGGTTWDIPLATGVPNDGSETITVPDNVTSTARVIVVGSGNIFYDVSDVNFEIVSNIPTYALNAFPAFLDICPPYTGVYDFSIEVSSIMGFTTPVDLSVSGLPGTSSATITSPVTPGNTATLSISDVDGSTSGNYTVTVSGNAGGTMRSVDIQLNLLEVPAAVTLNSPIDGAMDIASLATLSWTGVPFASTYDVEVATDSGFANIISSQTGVVPTNTTVGGLASGAVYYWRVRAVNSCGPGAYSPTFSFSTADVAACQDAVSDGGFEASLSPNFNWTEAANYASPPAFITTTSPNTGTNSLEFSGDVGFSVAYQAVTVPADGLNAVMTYSYRIDSSNPTCSGAGIDIGGVVISADQNGSFSFLPGNVLVLCTANSSSTYVEATIDLSTYIGQTIDLGFGVIAESANSTLFVDDVELEFCTQFPEVPVVAGTYSANLEITDLNGWTHYVNDNGTTITDDDVLILSIQKNGNDIGSVGDAGFDVSIVVDSGNTLVTAPYTSQFINDWISMNRHWVVTPTNQPITDVNVRHYYTDTDYANLNTALGNILTQHEDMTFWKINGNAFDPNPVNGHAGISDAAGYAQDGFWDYINGVTASTTDWRYSQYPSAITGPYHYGETVVGVFSGGGVGGTNASVLPVELLSFTGEATSAGNLLKWETASEQNNDRFELERSSSAGSDFEKIATISGAGNSSSRLTYQSLDERPSVGTNFYRLKQIDTNGSVEYSNIISIDYKSSGVVVLYPNPVKDELFISFDSKRTGEVNVEIYSTSGQLLRSWQQSVAQGRERLNFDAEGLLPGVYVIQLTNGKEVVSKRFIKQ